ncbi:copper resistance protein B [Edaphosphingomonas haloaromaticamans]|uniref:Copper resistance protein B n=1 Tax=Edaphosphingomonas haloaromaticamans TaxID=653954 RepID=A0A1S1HGT3_9SPHN|nr:copper resistance protein B [Sphingomonas haloaromaticamans]OHT21238.1 Copper resistance protein B precursor [Sphingomonas haloaromaticamans]
MKPLLAAALASALLAAPAYAQSADPHAGHDMPPAPPADPHAGHHMPLAAPVDPHAGHSMPPAAPVDPHAGHVVPPATPADPHAGHNMAPPPADAPPLSPPPAEALAGPRFAADGLFDPRAMAAARAQLGREHGGGTRYTAMLDRLEARIGNGPDAYLWDAQGWYGGDIDRLWLKAEGEGTFGGRIDDAEVQALWSHAIGPWFDLQAGLRGDFRPGPDRAQIVLGVQGLAPYWFEVDAAAFVSHKGDLTARAEVEYDQRLSQRLIFQPRVEIDLSAQAVRELGLGSGLTSIAAGARLRYEFAREFAPYVGVEYERKIGDTADFARDADEGVGGWRALIGIRAWF